MQSQLQKLLAMFDSQRPPSKKAREHIQYSAEVEQTLRDLEVHLHESDDPVEIAQYNITLTGKADRIDPVFRTLQVGETVVPFEDLVEISGESIMEIDQYLGITED